MNSRLSIPLAKVSASGALLLVVFAPPQLAGQPSAAALSSFGAYTTGVEDRLAHQHRSSNTFLASASSGPEDSHKPLRWGGFTIEKLTPPLGSAFNGALLHHWRGTAFAPGAKAADFERLMRDFNSYPRHFSPQVLHAKVLTQHGDRMEAWMRVRQQHVITVVVDTTYDITFGRLDAQHGYSISRSERVAEIDAAGTPAERELTSAEEHGFLWRLNTYWSYEERDGGLYLQVEAVSLTRAIPHGLGWAVRPYVESIPRESLEFTLRSVCNALHN